MSTHFENLEVLVQDQPGDVRVVKLILFEDFTRIESRGFH